MKSPCYDVSTKTDCPRRCGGCQVNCPDWAKYLQEREEMYKKRIKANEADSDYIKSRNRTLLKRKKH